jgi:hypothetical protein
MFGLFSKKTPTYPDKIWKTKDIAWKMMAAEAMRAIVEGRIPVIVFYFEGDLQQFEGFLAILKVPFQRLQSGEPVNEKTVLASSASTFDSDLAVKVLADKTQTAELIFLFAGHYPTLQREQQLLEKLTAAFPFTASFWMSVDDPFFEVFGGTRMRSLVETLGYKDDECIEHAMVTRSIRNAREKLDRSVRQEKPAFTQQEWFEKNTNLRG